VFSSSVHNSRVVANSGLHLVGELIHVGLGLPALPAHGAVCQKGEAEQDEAARHHPQRDEVVLLVRAPRTRIRIGTGDQMNENVRGCQSELMMNLVIFRARLSCEDLVVAERGHHGDDQ
jgi:hypothetical protein